MYTPLWEVDDHNILAEKYKDKKCVSVIVFHKRLKDELYDDPKHMLKTNKLLLNQITQDAIKKIGNNWWSQDYIQTLISQHNIPLWASNDSTEKENNAFKQKVFDEIYQSQILIESIKLLDQYKIAIEHKFNEDDEEYCYDENDDPILLSEDEYNQLLEKKLLDWCMPKLMIEYSRNYNHAPEPFNHWDNRNFWQQYFFIENDNGDSYVQGGMASSGQRENQGRFAHTFATLTKKYNKTIPTILHVYDENNVFKPLTAYETFKVLPHELSGNYQSNENIKELFDGLLIYYKMDFENNNFEIIDDYKYS